MVRNEDKIKQAVEFRQRGFTLEEIAKICDVSKSTVSKWLKNKAFSENITKQNKRRAGQENAKRLKLINKARSTERNKRYKQTEQFAVTEYKHYKNSPLFVAGLVAYMASGDRKNEYMIRLSSKDQVIHRLFISFCVEYLGVEKHDITLWLLLYPSHDEEVCMRAWKRSTKLPLAQFGKTQFIKSNTQKKPLHYGVGNTIIGNTVLKRKLKKWLQLAEEDLTV